MEKYHDWRDSFTGIHPFLPVPLNMGAGVVLGLVRLPFVLVLLGLVLFLDAVLPMLRGLLGVIILRPLLLLCGMWPTVTQRGVAKSGASVFFSNHKSYFDLLCTAAVIGPSHFCFVFGDVMVVHESLLSALLFMVRRLSPSSEAKIPISDLKKLPRALCFPEGVTSNHEKCFLALDQEFAKTIDELGLKYEFVQLWYSSKVTAFLGLEGSFFVHLLSVLSVPWQTARLIRMTGESGGFEAGWEKLSLVSGHKRLKLDWEDKQDFLAVWNVRK